mmetsp:Transcript_21854/g.21022  ORF Transcript_21854/g.21022 Transcript_21854/m.21022 type:complete len:120 (+) Transcript_21854:5328-5687(+)
MPGNYQDYDFTVVERRNSKQKVEKKGKSQQLHEIKEQHEDREENSSSADDNKLDEIWELDEDEEEPKEKDEDEISDNSYLEKPEKDQEHAAESLVSGVSEYNEFRLGSVRFEKEMQSKK